jgi:hypothetical protein
VITNNAYKKFLPKKLNFAIAYAAVVYIIKAINVDTVDVNTELKKNVIKLNLVNRYVYASRLSDDGIVNGPKRISAFVFIEEKNTQTSGNTDINIINSSSKDTPVLVSIFTNTFIPEPPANKQIYSF